VDIEYFNSKKEKAREVYGKHKTIFSPYLNVQVILNSDGFHHLQFSDRRERSKEEQSLKFSLLLLALEIIRRSTTLQEYRKEPIRVRRPSKDGLSMTKIAEYFGFIAITGERKIKIRAIVRRIGDGNYIFWSVMPDSKLRGGQKLYDYGIEDN